MTREEVMRRLKGHEGELRKAGLGALYLFGSTARNEASETSDIDLLFEVGIKRRFNLIDQARIQDHLEALLGSHVDLLERAGLRPQIRTQVEPELVRIF